MKSIVHDEKMSLVVMVVVTLLLSLAFLAAVSLKSKADAPGGALLFWNMETIDEDGYMQNLAGDPDIRGTLAGHSTDVAGYIGRARAFFGTTSQAVSTDALPQLWNAITFCAYLRVYSTGDYKEIIAKQQWFAGGREGWDIYITNTGRMTVRICDEGNEHTVDIGLTSINTWYHVCGVWSRTENSGNVLGYLNGAYHGVSATGTTAVVGDETSSPTFKVAAYPGDTSSWLLDGEVDEVRIYDYALTAPQVAALYADTTEYPTDELREWTTSWHFDEGTKSASGGNYEMETNTDNPGITTNQIELGSIKGDRFNYDDADADTWKWDYAETAAESTTHTIASGVLTLGIERTGLGTTRRNAVSTASTISGNLDVRIKIDEITATANDRGHFCVANEAGLSSCEGGSATVDGIIYLRLDASHVSALTMTDGVVTAIGDLTANANDPLWLRITRTVATNTITWYYSSDGSTWTQDEQTVFATSSNLYVYAYNEDNGNDAAETVYEYDDYHVAAGTIDAGGFRTTGDWLSTEFEIREGWHLDDIVFEGSFTATDYITQFDVLCGGTTVITVTDDITSSSYTYEAGNPEFHGSCQVRVYLAGTGGPFPVTTAPAALTSLTVTISEREDKDGRGGDAAKVMKIECRPGVVDVGCTVTLDFNVTGVAFTKTMWYIDGRYQGTGKDSGNGRQHFITMGAFSFPEGMFTVHVTASFTNGQTMELDKGVHANNWWMLAVCIMILLSVAVMLALFKSIRRSRRRTTAPQGDPHAMMRSRIIGGQRK